MSALQSSEAKEPASHTLQDETRRFIPWLTWSAALSFVVMTLGSLVRATDSGLSCPDWPLCYDQVVPSFDYQIFLEWFHRLLAGSLAVVMVIAFVKLFKSKSLRKELGGPIAAAGILFTVQVVLGGLTVLHLLDPKVVSLHLMNAICFYGILLWMNLRARRIVKPQLLLNNAKSKSWLGPAFIGLTTLIFVQLILGGMVSSNHAGLVCPDFPLCNGQWLPDPLPFLVGLQQFHRFVAYALMGVTLLLGMGCVRMPVSPTVRMALRSLPTIVMLQIILGVTNVLMRLPDWASVLHLANALLLFTVSFVATLDLFMSRAARQAGKPTGGTSKAKTLFQLTKPTITLLVVVTTIPGLLLATTAPISSALMLWTLLGTTLASASASAFNHVVDHELDEIMARTQKRPLPTGRVSRLEAAIFAGILGILSFVMLYRFTTPLAAWVSLAANVFYVVGYTMYLKRRTVQNIVIGGAAGAVGPLIGWAAVRGDIGWPAWVLFLVIFLWTPPHFWSLAIKYKNDYAKANIPMWPVIKGDESTRWQIFAYTLTLIPAVFALYYFGAASWLYLVPALAFTLYFVYVAARLYFDHTNERAMKVFHYSCLYLFGVFGGVTIDRLFMTF